MQDPFISVKCCTTNSSSWNKCCSHRSGAHCGTGGAKLLSPLIAASHRRDLSPQINTVEGINLDEDQQNAIAFHPGSRSASDRNHQRLAGMDGEVCDANSCPGLFRALRPLYSPSGPLGSALTQTLRRDLRVPEGESRPDGPAAATCLGMEHGGLPVGAQGSGQSHPCVKGGLDKGEWPEEGDDPSGITTLENRWKSPKFWVTAVFRVTTVPWE